MINDGFNLSIIWQFPGSLTNIHGLIRQGIFAFRNCTSNRPKGLNGQVYFEISITSGGLPGHLMEKQLQKSFTFIMSYDIVALDLGIM